MRPVLEYCSPIFHHSLPDCLSERVQKRALSIIAPDKSYKHCLVSFGLSTLYDRRNDQCIKLFNSISPDQHKFACLLSPNHQGYYNTRQERVYDLPHFRTNRCKIRSNQPCAVVQSCYYNIRLSVITSAEREVKDSRRSLFQNYYFGFPGI